MGQITNSKAKKEVKEEIKKEVKEEIVKNEENNIVEEEDDNGDDEPEQDGVSVHSPCKIPKTSLIKEKSDAEVELKLLEALEFFPPSKLRGPHRHFVIYCITVYMKNSLGRPFTADEVLKLLERFYNLDMVKPDDEDAEFLSHEEDFRLPQSYFVDDDS